MGLLLSVAAWAAHKTGLSYGEFVSSVEKEMNQYDIEKINCEYRKYQKNNCRSYNPNDERDKKIFSMYNSGLSDAKIALEIGVCEDTIRRWRIRKDLTPNGRKKCFR